MLVNIIICIILKRTCLEGMSADFPGTAPNSSGIDFFLPTVQRRPCGLRLRKLEEQPVQNVKETPNLPFVGLWKHFAR